MVKSSFMEANFVGVNGSQFLSFGLFIFVLFFVCLFSNLATFLIRNIQRPSIAYHIGHIFNPGVHSLP